MLLVNSSCPCSTILTDASCQSSVLLYTNSASSEWAGREKRRAGTYMIRPTGKTAPPRNLTSPGFDALRPGEPPDTISERRPPNESITPAATYQCHCGSRPLRKLVGSLTGCTMHVTKQGTMKTNRLEEYQICSRLMLGHSALDHRHRDLDGLEGAWGVEGGHRRVSRREKGTPYE